MYDVIIIGSGPAGMAAAIYAERAKLNTLVLEKNYITGGQVLTTYEVDNYPGFPGVSGMELSTKFKEHAEKLGTKVTTEDVTEIIAEDDLVKVITKDNTYEAKTLVVATGATHRHLNVPGEEELTGMGVSYCATCDGAFFKNRTTAVIGGGDVAIEDAIFLARICEKVYVIHRRDELRGAKSLQEKLFTCDNVEMVWDSVVEKINGEDMVESLTVKNVKDGSVKELETNGVFIAVGITPNSSLLNGVVDLDEAGYVKADENGVTSHKRIFAVGDVRTKALRQIVTAVADGANAINMIANHLL